MAALLAARIAELASTDKAPSAVVDAILREAAGARASDVHFEPVDSGLDIRFRLDGVLVSVAAVPPEIASPVVARLKVLAGLATYRTEVPQDGRIAGEALSSPKGKVPGGPDRTWHADLRLSTYPTVRGEKAVVRLFTARAEDFRLETLGLGENVRAALERALTSREGLVVLTGPAGSGKTTTLYAAIQHVRDVQARTSLTAEHAETAEKLPGLAVPEESPSAPSASSAVRAPLRFPRRHIVTIEDPAECLLPGITQTETNPPAGLTFANCLRSMLRQDPEVIMVGEVRDAETASLALEAALTGHLVLTTLHAGTSGGIFARLLDMGIEPHFITSVVRVAVAQRLVRRLCQECRRRDEDNGAWQAPGCDSCLGTGFRGRLPLAEVLTLTPELRKAVLARSDLGEIERASRASGLVPLAARGEELIADGETTEAEVARVLAGTRA
ncbi:MAG: GspE/PulE family protein [Planctomycetota bacterium]|jgi:type II secretory ATPase GspE/PulE/Tfp pilus assembly ATPase PilB-like protein